MKFKKFQFEDIALAALLDGVILSWEPGLGKTLAAIAWALIKDARRVLLVVPGQLHCHFVREAALQFDRHITPLQHWRQLRGFGINRPFASAGCRFFITTYQDLGFNNTRGGDPTLAAILAELGPDSGFDCIIVDEGTRLQSTETHIANGVRMLNPRYRMILTGTPVKNRLESFFWLGWWAAGGSALGNPLWPYEATDAARERFANEHLMRIRSEGTRPARTARITNIHDLWHLLAPLVVRRRKSNCGERIPPKIVRPIRVQPGREQAAVYASHLHFPPYMSSQNRIVNGFGQVAMQLNILRQAALCPHTPAIGRVHSMATGPKFSSTDFNPKLAVTLSLIARLISKGEQVIIGSPFRAFSHSLYDRLREAGVSALLLDGETKPAERGRLAEEFKVGRHSVLVVGIAAMSEGHSFENCSNLILPSLSWAYDENEQFVNRVWRLNSPKPVTVYPIITAGTIDERMAEMFAEKTDSAQLALDGRLIADNVQETDLSALLRHSVRAFNPAAATIDEGSIQVQFITKLRSRLTKAEVRYRKRRDSPPPKGARKTRRQPSPTKARRRRQTVQ